VRILLVSPFLPHRSVRHAGGKFVYLCLCHLCRRHEVDLVTRLFPGEEGPLGEVRAVARTVFPVREPGGADPRGGIRPAKVFSYLRLARAAESAAAAGSYDAALVEYTETAVFLRMRRFPPAALDAHDIVAKPWERRFEDSRGLDRLALGLAYRAFAAAERQAVRKFRVLFTKSRYDADWARARYAHGDVRPLPHPAGEGIDAEARAEVPGRLLFLGAMGRPLNVEAAIHFYEKVLPAVVARRPEARFWVVGSDPPERLQALAENDPRVRVTGYVEDIGAAYREASVFVAPILVGGGIIAKILDAMAVGVPVVTTAYGNEGIEARDGREILVADGPEAFAARVIGLLEDPGLRRRIGDAGRDFVRERYATETVMADLERGMRDVAGGGSGQGDGAVG
jgi:glycosyltransferase involved in cell wall biosynthesis